MRGGAGGGDGVAAMTPDDRSPAPDAQVDGAPNLPRCFVTGNPCGTDTWAVGSTCRCSTCAAYCAGYDAAVANAALNPTSQPAPGAGRTHVLKCWPEPFEAMRDERHEAKR